MNKYTILYKNGKTWNGRANSIYEIPVVNCLFMVFTKDELLEIYFNQEGQWFRSKTHYQPASTKTYNPKSKTKKQKQFDKDYVQWVAGREHWQDRSIREYKKWLYDNKLLKDNGFIPWSGGPCPVPTGTMVHVRYRNGEESIVTAMRGQGNFRFKQIKGRLAATYWGTAHSPSDIVAYKIYKETQPKEVKPFVVGYDLASSKDYTTTYTFWLGEEGEKVSV